MLNSDTKRHIDAARDVLVGVAPNPTTQIDQITYALIYKFMDDMDQAAIKAGGEPSFFTGDLEQYAWSSLMSARVGNQEKVNLYSDALTKFSEAKHLPELFRTIFRAAFLPYRSPETLGLFLKEISYFDYSHPEELGNAYEYLLSIMSSQGDAGQFRTPRHIIDFIVDVINPTKDDKVLDPACGTGGFLVSTYNHILEQHDGKDDPNNKEKLLTPDERKKLMSNLQGYDIDPTMVRIAQVNMYLHQFKNPQIFQYDSLTSEERWNDKYDVILANPPFMSPKGGIKPHNKFGITSNRAEVIFIDYIINHLKPKGRAGIIVPEGIIFQSGKAYKELRKNLLENGLYSVVSLPGGVFQPYSGVKTSILLLDNELAKQKTEIAFVKISADGYDLGSSKREVSSNDLPEALRLLQNWSSGNPATSALVSYVGKEEISKSGDYNLSGDRYRKVVDHSNTKWPMRRLSEITTLITDGSHNPPKAVEFSDYLMLSSKDIRDGEILLNAPRYISKEDYEAEHKRSKLKNGDVLLTTVGTIGRSAVYRGNLQNITFQRSVTVISPEHRELLSSYLMYTLQGMRTHLNLQAQGVAQKGLYLNQVRELEIPLPPLDVQKKIVAELDGFATIISGARQIVENWKPNIDVDVEWPIVELGVTCQFINGDRSTNYPTIRTQDSSGIPFLNAGDLFEGCVSLEKADFITEEQFAKIGGGKLEIGDVLFCLRGSLGKMAINKEISRGAIASSLIILRANPEQIAPTFLYTVLASEIGQGQIKGHQTGAAQPNLAATNLKTFQIPLPSLGTQNKIVERIHVEENQIQSVKDLIEVYEARAQAVIAKLWSK